MTQTNHSAMATVAHTDDTAMRTNYDAPPGRNASSGYRTIILTDDAATIAPNQGIADLLPELSALVSAGKNEQEIVALLATMVTNQEIARARLFIDGRHTVRSGTFIAAGKAVVHAEGTGIAIALGDSQVTVRGEFDLYAADRARVSAYDDSQVFARDNVTVVGTYGTVRGHAKGHVRGNAHDRSAWSIEGKASFDGRDNANLEAYGDSTVRLYGRARVEASGNAAVTLRESATGWFRGCATGELWGESMAYSDRPHSIKIRGTSARILSMPASESLFQRRHFRAR
jgi:hypothetical protein